MILSSENNCTENRCSQIFIYNNIIHNDIKKEDSLPNVLLYSVEYSLMHYIKIIKTCRNTEPLPLFSKLKKMIIEQYLEQGLIFQL